MSSNLISALRNMADDIESLGAAPMTVDVNLIREAIAALTPPDGYVLVPVEPTEAMIAEAWKYGYADDAPDPVYSYRAMLAARQEVK